MLHVAEDILSIFIMQVGEIPTPISFQGTGVLVAPELFITCWHCINTVLSENQYYAVAVQKDGGFKTIRIHDIERDQNGCDLASAKVSLKPGISFKLAVTDPPIGTSIFSFGYPLTSKKEIYNGTIQFEINGRYLQSYITRSFYYESPSYGKTLSYELGMPAPEGLSGAPIIKTKDKEIIGIVYGNLDTGTIEHFQKVDAETGDMEPEIQRIVSFGLAHHISNIHNLIGRATNYKTLKDYLSDIAGV